MRIEWPESVPRREVRGRGSTTELLSFELKFGVGAADVVCVERKRVAELAALRARDSLCAALGTAPPCPDSMLGSLAAVLFPERSPKSPAPEALYAALVARGIEVPIVTWPGRPSGFLRIAAQIYNSDAEFSALGAALREELGLNE